jgi:hypothetical protein
LLERSTEAARLRQAKVSSSLFFLELSAQWRSLAVMFEEQAQNARKVQSRFELCKRRNENTTCHSF